MYKKLMRVSPLFQWPVGHPFEGDPPEGVAYQVWNTITHSPVSPVYETEDGVIHWLMSCGYTRKWAVDFVAKATRIKEN